MFLRFKGRKRRFKNKSDLADRSAAWRSITSGMPSFGIQVARNPRGCLLVELTVRGEKSVRLEGDDSVSYGVLHQIGVSLELQKVHDRILVCRNGSFGDL
jgi:hypothetical protein